MAGIFARDTAVTTAARVASALLNLAAAAVVARALGPEGQGVYSLAALFPALLVVFNNMAFNSAAVYLIATRRYTPGTALAQMLYFTALASAVTLPLGWALVKFWGGALFPGVDPALLYLALALVPLLLATDLFSHILIALQKLISYNILSLLQSGLFLLFALALLPGSRLSPKTTLLAYAVSFVPAVIFIYTRAAKQAGGITPGFRPDYFRDAFAYGLKVYLGSVFSFVDYRVNMLLLNLFLNPAATGIYYAALRLAEGVWLVSSSASTVLFPRVASDPDPASSARFTALVCRTVLLSTTAIVLPLLLFCRPVMTLLYSESFAPGAAALAVLLAGAVAIGGWRILANDLSARGKPMIYTRVTGISILMNITLNIVLIPFWGVTGAAVAVSLSYFFRYLLTAWYYARETGQPATSTFIPQRGDWDTYIALCHSLRKKA
ncbi:MAG: oligosaccharide flippase family protein [Elusimicrobia bacterium]|nr:oligosaccharide flippase family protein [Elusimicrobiota bacterium]